MIKNLVKGIIYGPVDSRRFGRSLGINVSGDDKYCSFACPYCFRGYNSGRPNLPQYLDNLYSPEQIIEAVIETMEKPNCADVEDWTIAGNAEPTDYPSLAILIEKLLEARNQRWSQIQLSILSNGMGLVNRVNSHSEILASMLKKVDRLCLKLDAGLSETWNKMSGAAYKVSLDEWLAGAKSVAGCIIQTIMVDGRINNNSQQELDGLIQCYRLLQPREIHLYTINKTPADAKLIAITKEKMEWVREYLQNALDKTVVFSYF